MAVIQHNPTELFPGYQNYSHGVEVTGNSRLLFISGMNGYEQDGKSMPESFTEQGELIWQHIGAVLKSANMDYSNIISLRFYLASPEYDEENIALRKKYLGDNRPALTSFCW